MFNLYSHTQSELKSRISKHYRDDEKQCVQNLFNNLNLSDELAAKATNLARDLVTKVRDSRVKGHGLDALMQEFKLSNAEGVALMCLAESLLRIPDSLTQDKLIRDKIAKGDWGSHINTNNTFVNAASWGLLLTGKLVSSLDNNTLSAALLKVVASGGEPLIRRAMASGVRLMGKQFVMGKTIEEALKASVAKESKGYQFSYDMLGEAALNEDDAIRYMKSYTDAITAVGCANNNRGVHKGPGISVKLSAIHPRYQRAQYQRVISELYPRLKDLYLLAKEYQIGLFIDAEETERLEISLELLEMLVKDKDLAGFEGIGFVIQSYQKRAPYVIDYVADLARNTNAKIMVRLVKGAYWDSEIKKAQTDGQVDYPVFTRKFYTDLSYLACAEKLFSYQDSIYPLFATHNAHSLATIYYMGIGKQYEFQCLYGMGESLYDNIVGEKNLNITCRVYAPVGTHETLLAYLVRRLLENGANSSFVHQIVDKDIPIETLIESPVIQAQKADGESNPYFKQPAFIYPSGRINSKGFDLSDEITLSYLQTELNKFNSVEYLAYPLVPKLSKPQKRDKNDVFSPANLSDKVGQVIKGISEDIEIAVTNAENAFPSWSNKDPKERGEILLKMADKLEENYIQLLNILVREAGKTLANAISEVREAVDFCRYYGNQVIREFDNNTHKAIGTFVCISPWNFPLAIFLGEVSSCLASGNCVIAKPSYQTSLVAFFAVELFHASGVPEDVLQFMPGSGSIIGNQLTEHPRIQGVIFTGSTEVAQTINQNLAKKDFEPVLIAETGGQNAMIVDSSALPEPVVLDVISSGFDSAGQRCSALRVLYLQADIADKVLHMLKGAMNDLRVGNPTNLATDVGPVIDKSAQKTLLTHIEQMKKTARLFHQSKLSSECENGIYVAPTLVEIGSIHELSREVFGPVIHVIRFAAGEIDKVINEINSSGYGLTQGLHSRIHDTAVKVYENIKAGNIYINRNTVGAVVGVQPFGGEGLSGTGPKAGGAFYLYRLVNTTCHPQENFVAKQYKFTKLDGFVASLDRCGFSNSEQAELFDYADRVRNVSMLTKQIDLPGPTGEQNFMFFAKRGVIACFAKDNMSYARQIICAYATDNDVLLPEAARIFTRVLSSGSTVGELKKYSGFINASLISRDYNQIYDLRQELSKRDGCLVINIHERDNGEYNLHLLVTERTVSINTTATGGNLQLMSIDDRV
jgi:RHH-type proline utilization regulon transcriptional repressor/proline dehydrogenase/delta 1-pyrroline-5-carboxylate dehydrogenase